VNPLNQGTGAVAINEPGQNKTNFDRFLSNVSKRCFGLSGVLLKLCRLILGYAIKSLSVRSLITLGNLSLLEFIRASLSIAQILIGLLLPPQNCSFPSLIGFDITWTLYEVRSKKLCNPDVSTRVWSRRILAL